MVNKTTFARNIQVDLHCRLKIVLISFGERADDSVYCLDWKKENHFNEIHIDCLPKVSFELMAPNFLCGMENIDLFDRAPVINRRLFGYSVSI